MVKSRRKGFELEPWFLPRFPARILSLRGFFGQVFTGLRLTAFTSVLSGSSALLVFSFFPVSYFMYLSSYLSFALAHLLDRFSFYVCLGQLSWNRSLRGDISLV